MSRARPAATSSHQARSQVNLVWLTWFGVAGASLVILAITTVSNVDVLAHPPAEARDALSDAKVTAAFHAGYHAVLDLAFAAAGIVVSALLLRRSGEDKLAARTALVLAAWAPLNGLAVEAPLEGPSWSRVVVAASWGGWAWLAASSLRALQDVPGLRARQQARWVLYGAATSFVASSLVVGAIGTGVTLDPGEVDRHMTGHLLLVLAGGGFLASVVAAWLHPSAPDPDTLIRRTFVYGSLSALGVVATVAFVVLPALLYFELGIVYFLVLVSAWAVLGVPTQQWVQRTVNRLMYGQREEPMAVLTQLGERLELGSPETVLGAIVETVATTLKLPAVRIVSESGATIASVGASDFEEITLPISHHGEQVGQLVASVRARDEALHEHDFEILRLVARQAGPTVRAVQLNEELRRSRQEILEGREEERRRIRRDLHDGLGPALAAIAMQADTARAVVDDDPAAARDLMSAVTEQAKDVVHEVRRLVYDLRPPALDQLGLLGAVESLARQHSSPSLRVEVRSDGEVPLLHAAHEVAVYRIVSEALANVSRHSGASLAVVSFETVAGQLRVTVEDDGRGIDAAAPRGIGLRSMADRASEVGAALEVGERPGGGARIALALPLLEAPRNAGGAL